MDSYNNQMQPDNILRYAASVGADECELVRTRRRVTTIRITDSGVAEAKQNISTEYGIRIISEKRMLSSAATNERQLYGAVDRALEASRMIKPRASWKGLPQPETGIQSGTYDRRIRDISCKSAEDLARAMIDSAQGPASDMTVTGSLNTVYEEFELYNTNQIRYKDRATYITAFINATPKSDGGMSVSGMGHYSGRNLVGFDPEQTGSEAHAMCVRSLNPSAVDDSDGGIYTIIF